MKEIWVNRAVLIPNDRGDTNYKNFKDIRNAFPNADIFTKKNKLIVINDKFVLIYSVREY